MAFLPNGFRIDSDEWTNILTAIVAISLTLTLANGGLNITASEFVFLMAVFTLTVGTGFLLHELSHKYVAVKYGSHARFEAWTGGLVLMLALAIVPQALGWGKFPIFLAPGAVMIYASRQIGKKENGIISAAGPIANIVLAGIFFILAVLITGTIDVENAPYAAMALPVIFILGLKVNLFLAMFNLLPVFPLDGIKVFLWDWKVWALLFGISIIGTSVFTFGF